MQVMSQNVLEVGGLHVRNVLKHMRGGLKFVRGSLGSMTAMAWNALETAGIHSHDDMNTGDVMNEADAR